MKTKFVLFVLSILLFGFLPEQSFSQSGTKPEVVMYRYNSNGPFPSPVLVGDILGTIKYNGLTAIGDIRTGATIKSRITSVSPGLMSANMIFSTSNGATPSDHVIITQIGRVGIGTMTPAFELHTVGNTHTTGDFFGRIHMDPSLGVIGAAPNTYLEEAYFEYKQTADMAPTTGLTNLGVSGGLLTLAPSNNLGGNTDHQLFFNAGGIFHRKEAANNGSWTQAWEKLLTSNDINGTPNRVARFLPPDDPSSKLGNSQLYDNGANVVIGGSVAPFTAVPPFNVAYVLNVNGDSRMNGNADVVNALSVNGGSTLNSGTIMNGGATVNGLLTANNNGRVNGNLGLGVAPSGFRLDVAGNSRYVGNSQTTGSVAISSTSNPPTFGLNYALSVEGRIITDEIRVAAIADWPDYVFAENYDLQPLTEVEKYIQENNHLPGVASAKEVAENGLNLSEMQKAQMEKIEELYLHLIQQQKLIEQQQKTIERLESEINNLKK